MASRRSRIKGIANIPQRRKATNEEIKLTLTENETVGNEILENKVETVENSNNSNLTSNDAIKINLQKPENLTHIIKETLNNEESNIQNEPQQNSDNCDKNLTIVNQQSVVKPTTTLKRKFIKAPVSLNAIKNRKKPSQENLRKQTDTQVNESFETGHPDKSRVRDNIEGSPNSLNFTINIGSPNNNLSSTIDTEVIKNEEVSASLDLQNNVSKEDNIGNLFQKPVPLFSNTQHSDTEYPLPPPSPNKANRSRIKAIPRLAQRKHSFSASESEDESRKINRIRNDSICSTTSVVPEPITECFSPQRIRDPVFTSQVKKVIARSEQTRKFAEDRKDFYRRFGAKKPERHRLKMADLIFYNPQTNPMTNEENIQNNEMTGTEEVADDPNGETVDDPIKQDSSKSDEENEMPVPQIKIGPSGEIILDEQSLVVERKEVQRQREEMEKTKVIDADRMKTGYGIYKKHKRTKAWSHEETLLFYTVLNTVGTDFMAVTEFFPNRSRRDVKAKFKKEERINKHLIDKALGEPYRFDVDDLKHDIAQKTREMEELRKQKEMEIKRREERQKEILELKRKELENKKLKMLKPPSNKNHSDDVINVKDGTPTVAEETKEVVKSPIQEKESTQDAEEMRPSLKRPSHQKPRTKKPKKEKLSIKRYMSDSDADESDIATQSESDDDIILSHKPTRSGRVPKLTQRYEDEVNLNSMIKESSRLPNRSELKNVEPGSVMIVTEEGPNGEPIYKIFMVTQDQEAAPLNIPSDDVAKVIQLKKGFSAHNIMTISSNATTDEEEENSIENNFTIPEDKNVTTLKSCGENSVDAIMDQNITIPADPSVTSLRSRVENSVNVDTMVTKPERILTDDESPISSPERTLNDSVVANSERNLSHEDSAVTNSNKANVNRSCGEKSVIIKQNIIIPADPMVACVISKVDNSVNVMVSDPEQTLRNEGNVVIKPERTLHNKNSVTTCRSFEKNSVDMIIEENITIPADAIVFDNTVPYAVYDSFRALKDENNASPDKVIIPMCVDDEENTENRTENFTVIATESTVLGDPTTQNADNILILPTHQNNLPVNTEIVFTVNSDGMCSKVLSEDCDQLNVH